MGSCQQSTKKAAKTAPGTSGKLTDQAPFSVEWSRLQGPQLLQLKFSGQMPAGFTASLRIASGPGIAASRVKENILEITTDAPFRLDRHYYLKSSAGQSWFLTPDGILDSLYSEKPLGHIREAGQHVFRLFAPRAIWVRLVLFENHQDAPRSEIEMRRDEDGVWEHFSEANLYGKYYGYRVWGPSGEGEIFDSTLVLADPYSKAVVTRNHYSHPARTLILPEQPFDWGSQERWIRRAPRDQIIYEMHVRDMTVHPSSQLSEELRGSYGGLVHPQQIGGIQHIKRLGVNTVQLLPIHNFGNIEIPYRDSSGVFFNTWNPYARNHWGYMTSHFFAPENYYARGGNMKPGAFNGVGGKTNNEVKSMVKAFHSENIAVFLDVVYNHVSQYDENAFKYIDKYYYFRLKNNGEFEGISGCGNDFKTERPMARRMIVESVLYWMKEYHIDGFRFDLAKLIDWETCDAIIKAARQVNPDVAIIAEPWGGGYDPAGFSDHGWAAWNDRLRNGYKGWNPVNDRGFIFGEFQGEMTRKNLENFVRGSLREAGEQFTTVDHSVNYLESHDDHTLGDFIRIGLNPALEKAVVNDIDKDARLTPAQMRLNKLAALALLTSQGTTMIHAGQEYARSKVIAEGPWPDSAIGHIDHNSYEKDNETNWLNFDHAEMNRELFNYYSGLIALRKQYPAFRHAKPDQITFQKSDDKLLLVYRIRHEKETYLVALNGNRTISHLVDLPAGDWRVLVDARQVYRDGTKQVAADPMKVAASTGLILKKVAP